LVGYEGDFSEITPRRSYNRMFKPGQLKRHVLDILRVSEGEPDCREIATEVVCRYVRKRLARGQ